MKKIFLISALLTVSLFGFATIVNIDGVYYYLDEENKTAEVTYEELVSDNNYPELTSVTIPETVTFNSTTYSVTSIGRYAFALCFGLTSVEIPNSVTSINQYAFMDCTGLTSVRIPDSVISIGSGAFQGCKALTSVEIPKSVRSIGNEAFWQCTGLTGVYITDLEAWCKIDFPHGIYVSSNPLYYAHHLYLNNEEVKHLIIPETVQKIKNRAFSQCYGLTLIEIPNSVISIGEDAFSYCKDVTELYIGENVRSIGENAFLGCTFIHNITMCPLDPPEGKSNIFYASIYDNATLYVPESSLGLYKARAPWGKFFKIKTLDESGVDEIAMEGSETLYDIINLKGQIVKRNATRSDIEGLDKGIYIIGGKKVMIK